MSGLTSRRKQHVTGVGHEAGGFLFEEEGVLHGEALGRAEGGVLLGSVMSGGMYYLI